MKINSNGCTAYTRPTPPAWLYESADAQTACHLPETLGLVNRFPLTLKALNIVPLSHDYLLMKNRKKNKTL